MQNKDIKIGKIELINVDVVHFWKINNIVDHVYLSIHDYANFDEFL